MVSEKAKLFYWQCKPMQQQTWLGVCTLCARCLSAQLPVQCAPDDYTVLHDDEMQGRDLLFPATFWPLASLAFFFSTFSQHLIREAVLQSVTALENLCISDGV